MADDASDSLSPSLRAAGLPLATAANAAADADAPVSMQVVGDPFSPSLAPRNVGADADAGGSSSSALVPAPSMGGKVPTYAEPAWKERFDGRDRQQNPRVRTVEVTAAFDEYMEATFGDAYLTLAEEAGYDPADYNEYDAPVVRFVMVLDAAESELVALQQSNPDQALDSYLREVESPANAAAMRLWVESGTLYDFVVVNYFDNIEAEAYFSAEYDGDGWRGLQRERELVLAKMLQWNEDRRSGRVDRAAPPPLTLKEDAVYRFISTNRVPLRSGAEDDSEEDEEAADTALVPAGGALVASVPRGPPAPLFNLATWRGFLAAMISRPVGPSRREGPRREGPRNPIFLEPFWYKGKTRTEHPFHGLDRYGDLNWKKNPRVVATVPGTNPPQFLEELIPLEDAARKFKDFLDVWREWLPVSPEAPAEQVARRTRDLVYYLALMAQAADDLVLLTYLHMKSNSGRDAKKVADANKRRGDNESVTERTQREKAGLPKPEDDGQPVWWNYFSVRRRPNNNDDEQSRQGVDSSKRGILLKDILAAPGSGGGMFQALDDGDLRQTISPNVNKQALHLACAQVQTCDLRLRRDYLLCDLKKGVWFDEDKVGWDDFYVGTGLPLMDGEGDDAMMVQSLSEEGRSVLPLLPDATNIYEPYSTLISAYVALYNLYAPEHMGVFELADVSSRGDDGSYEGARYEHKFPEGDIMKVIHELQARRANGQVDEVVPSLGITSEPALPLDRATHEHAPQGNGARDWSRGQPIEERWANYTLEYSVIDGAQSYAPVTDQAVVAANVSRGLPLHDGRSEKERSDRAQALLKEQLKLQRVETFIRESWNTWSVDWRTRNTFGEIPASIEEREKAKFRKQALKDEGLAAGTEIGRLQAVNRELGTIQSVVEADRRYHVMDYFFDHMGHHEALLAAIEKGTKNQIAYFVAMRKSAQGKLSSEAELDGEQPSRAELQAVGRMSPEEKEARARQNAISRVMSKEVVAKAVANGNQYYELLTAIAIRDDAIESEVKMRGLIKTAAGKVKTAFVAAARVQPAAHAKAVAEQQRLEAKLLVMKNRRGYQKSGRQSYSMRQKDPSKEQYDGYEHDVQKIKQAMRSVRFQSGIKRYSAENTKRGAEKRDSERARNAPNAETRYGTRKDAFMKAVTANAISWIERYELATHLDRLNDFVNPLTRNLYGPARRRRIVFMARRFMQIIGGLDIVSARAAARFKDSRNLTRGTDSDQAYEERQFLSAVQEAALEILGGSMGVANVAVTRAGAWMPAHDDRRNDLINSNRKAAYALRVKDLRLGKAHCRAATTDATLMVLDFYKLYSHSAESRKVFEAMEEAMDRWDQYLRKQFRLYRAVAGEDGKDGVGGASASNLREDARIDLQSRAAPGAPIVQREDIAYLRRNLLDSILSTRARRDVRIRSIWGSVLDYFEEGMLTLSKLGAIVARLTDQKDPETEQVDYAEIKLHKYQLMLFDHLLEDATSVHRWRQKVCQFASEVVEPFQLVDEMRRAYDAAFGGLMVEAERRLWQIRLILPGQMREINYADLDQMLDLLDELRDGLNSNAGGILDDLMTATDESKETLLARITNAIDYIGMLNAPESYMNAERVAEPAVRALHPEIYPEYAEFVRQALTRPELIRFHKSGNEDDVEMEIEGEEGEEEEDDDDDVACVPRGDESVETLLGGESGLQAQWANKYREMKEAEERDDEAAAAELQQEVDRLRKQIDTITRNIGDRRNQRYETSQIRDGRYRQPTRPMWQMYNLVRRRNVGDNRDAFGRGLPDIRPPKYPQPLDEQREDRLQRKGYDSEEAGFAGSDDSDSDDDDQPGPSAGGGKQPVAGLRSSREGVKSLSDVRQNPHLGPRALYGEAEGYDEEMPRGTDNISNEKFYAFEGASYSDDEEPFQVNWPDTTDPALTTVTPDQMAERFRLQQSQRMRDVGDEMRRVVGGEAAVVQHQRAEQRAARRTRGPGQVRVPAGFSAIAWLMLPLRLRRILSRAPAYELPVWIEGPGGEGIWSGLPDGWVQVSNLGTVMALSEAQKRGKYMRMRLQPDALLAAFDAGLLLWDMGTGESDPPGWDVAPYLESTGMSLEDFQLLYVMEPDFSIKFTPEGRNRAAAEVDRQMAQLREAQAASRALQEAAAAELPPAPAPGAAGGSQFQGAAGAMEVVAVYNENGDDQWDEVDEWGAGGW